MTNLPNNEDKDKNKEMEDKNKDIKVRLKRVMDFLSKQSTFDGDSLSWAAHSIKLYLDGSEKTLDHAFGLRSSKTGKKPMESGTHDDWVAAAWCEVVTKTPIGKEYPSTKTMAKIGRYYGLGGKDASMSEDSGIASELKRILTRYRQIIVDQISTELSDRWNEE